MTDTSVSLNEYMKQSNRIFVFGSNLAGRHGAGSALHAVKKHGAVRGKGHGWYGNSYAIPTKDYNLETLPLDKIKMFVDIFLEFAELSKDHLVFDIVAVGCGYAGYKYEQIAPLFKNAPNNCNLPKEFKRILEKEIL